MIRSSVPNDGINRIVVFQSLVQGLEDQTAHPLAARKARNGTIIERKGLALLVV